MTSVDVILNDRIIDEIDDLLLALSRTDDDRLANVYMHMISLYCLALESRGVDLTDLYQEWVDKFNQYMSGGQNG